MTPHRSHEGAPWPSFNPVGHEGLAGRVGDQVSGGPEVAEEATPLYPLFHTMNGENVAHDPYDLLDDEGEHSDIQYGLPEV